MNTRRYVVCGVVSIALHSLAISAKQPVQEIFAVEDTQTGQHVAIQLVARASQPASVSPENTVSDPVSDTVSDTKAPEPVVKQPEPAKSEVKKTAPKPTPKPIPKPAPKPEPKSKPKPVEKQAKPVTDPVKKPRPALPISKDPNPNTPHTMANADMNQAKDSAPRLIDRPTFKVRPTQPTYPRIARRKGLEGNVLLDVWLDEKGEQTRLEIAKSSGHAVLDEAAIKAVKKWRFNGYQENGIRLAHRVKIPVRFNLD
ncbi:energy transducer TonB [Photobacterium japonica]|uniref:energy transducer TonB n=1 Tax=Photobacterium japonica TaxID=2910235 RepID=UPI003D123E6B